MPKRTQDISNAQELVRRIGLRCSTIDSYAECDREHEAEKRLGEFHGLIAHFYSSPLSELTQKDN